jgi:glutaredoxin-related protein
MILAPFQSHRPPVSSPLRASLPLSSSLPIYNEDIPDTPGRQRAAFISTAIPVPIPLQLRLRLKLLPALNRLPRRKLLSFIALFALLIVSILTLSRGLLSTSYSSTSPQSPTSPSKLKYTLGQSTRLFLQRKQIELSPPDELAAVIQFLTSQTSNSLPLSVNPSEPIDPQLVCGFDTRSQRAMQEVKWMREDVWNQHPVMLFIELRSTASRALTTIINDLNLSPPPTVFTVDDRSDATVLVPLLQRLTTSPSLPILLVGGEVIGPSIENIEKMNESGTLKDLITRAGGVIDGAKRKRTRRR